MPDFSVAAGKNLEYDGLPLNQALALGVHEGQSLL